MSFSKKFIENDWQNSNATGNVIIIPSDDHNIENPLVEVFQLEDDGSYSPVTADISILRNNFICINSNIKFSGKYIVK